MRFCKRFRRHLSLPQEIALIIVLKLILLFVIWWQFFAPHKVHPDENDVFIHMQGYDLSREE